LKLRQMGTQGVRLHMKGVISCLIRWACRACTGDFGPALAALVGAVQNIFFLTVHYFTSFVPIIQHAGQPVVPRRMSLKMCLWSWNTFKGPDWVMRAKQSQPVTNQHHSF
jgi:hypothetical protein